MRHMMIRWHRGGTSWESWASDHRWEQRERADLKAESRWGDGGECWGTRGRSCHGPWSSGSPLHFWEKVTLCWAPEAPGVSLLPLELLGVDQAWGLLCLSHIVYCCYRPRATLESSHRWQKSWRYLLLFTFVATYIFPIDGISSFI